MVSSWLLEMCKTPTLKVYVFRPHPRHFEIVVFHSLLYLHILIMQKSHVSLKHWIEPTEGVRCRWLLQVCRSLLVLLVCLSCRSFVLLVCRSLLVSLVACVACVLLVSLVRVLLVARVSLIRVSLVACVSLVCCWACWGTSRFQSKSAAGLLRQRCVGVSTM